MEVAWPHSENERGSSRVLCVTIQMLQRPPYDPDSLLANNDRPIEECLVNFAAERHQFRAEWRGAGTEVWLARGMSKNVETTKGIQ